MPTRINLDLKKKKAKALLKMFKVIEFLRCHCSDISYIQDVPPEVLHHSLFVIKVLNGTWVTYELRKINGIEVVEIHSISTNEFVVESIVAEIMTTLDTMDTTTYLNSDDLSSYRMLGIDKLTYHNSTGPLPTIT